MAVQIQLRRGTAAQWTSANPTLASGEIGIETDTKKEKVGDGTTAWNSLGYFNVNGISFGTTGLTPSTSTSGNVTVAGTLVVANGGTGLTTIPAGNVVIGNGTSALYGVAPGTAGNVLTSIAGVWTSNAAVGGGGSPGGSTTQVQYNNAGSFAGDANLTFSGSTLTSANLIVSNLTVSQAVFSSATKQLVSNPITGTGSVVMNASPIITSPSLITPALGSPTSGNMAATTSIPVANATGTLAVANGGTGLTSTPANGALDIGNGTNFTRTTLTAGTNVTITNGVGSITIAAAGGSGSPGGSSGQIQYNNAGSFGGFANLTYNLTGPIVTTTIGVGGTTPSTSGSGVSFPATQSPSTDANTLDDYEEGTWTPVDSSGAGLTLTVSGTSKYIKVGRTVTLCCNVTYPATASTAGMSIGGFPFTIDSTGSSNMQGLAISNTNRGVAIYGLAIQNDTRIATTDVSDVNQTNLNFSAKTIRFSVTYITTT
jgi:Major tropism determinant N-terminal domain